MAGHSRSVLIMPSDAHFYLSPTISQRLAVGSVAYAWENIPRESDYWITRWQLFAEKNVLPGQLEF